MRQRTVLFFVAGALFAWTGAARAQVAVTATVSTDTIGLNESLEYEVTVGRAGLKEVSEPELELPPGLTLFGTSRSSEVSIQNGAVERTTTFSLVYRPFKTGTVVIGPASVRVGAARYSAPPVEITVVPSRPSATAPALAPQREDTLLAEPGRVATGLPTVFVTNRLDREQVYVGQQVVLTFAFYQSARAMVLDQPNYSSAKTPGFWMQDLNRDPEITRELIGGDAYTIQRFYYALFPLTPGAKVIAPASLTLTVRDPVTLFDRGRTLTLNADTLRLTVLPLPQQGRPPGFAGTVGRYRVEARAEPRRVEQDAPATVVVTVSGEGNIATVPAPRLAATRHLKVFDPEVKSRVEPRDLRVRGEKEFRYLVVPKRAGALELGSAVLDYFDPEARVYRRASTELGTLAVSPVGSRDNGDTERAVALAEIRDGPLDSGPRAPWRNPVFWVVTALPLVGLGVLASGLRRPARAARPAALRPSAEELRREPSPEGAATLERRLEAYLEATYGVPLAGRAVAGRELALRSAGAPEEVASRAATAFRALESLRFAPVAARTAMVESAIAALAAFERAAAPGRRWSRRATPRAGTGASSTTAGASAGSSTAGAATGASSTTAGTSAGSSIAGAATGASRQA